MATFCLGHLDDGSLRELNFMASSSKPMNSELVPAAGAAGPIRSPDEDRHFFASAGHALYGVLRPGTRPNAPLIMFCNSFAADQDAKWRAEVIGAREATARGFTTFSYHPRGHGDSSGNFASITFDDLVDDALNAAQHALERSGANRLICVGIRFGALVAAELIRRRGDVSALALWEPIHAARGYFRELMRQNLYREMAQRARPSVNVDEMMERLLPATSITVPGFQLYGRFSSSAIGKELMQSLETWRGPTLLAQFRKRTELTRENLRLRRMLQRRGIRVAAVVVREKPIYNGRDDPWLSAGQLIESTSEWFDGLG